MLLLSVFGEGLPAAITFESRGIAAIGVTLTLGNMVQAVCGELILQELGMQFA
jgi:hypothetical protein